MYSQAVKMAGYGIENTSTLCVLKSARCPLCNSKPKSLYCVNCVTHGNFYHSSMKIPER